MSTYCRGPGCHHLARRNGLCEGHSKQAARGQPLTALKEELSPFGLVVESAIALADAEQDEDFKAARDRLRHAARRWAREDE